MRPMMHDGPRGPDPGDLSPTNSDGFQVWAVGFYNDAGALRLGEIFADPCDPAIPSSLTFPEGTASVKFLFTDASPGEVAYLAGGPEYDAMIDSARAGSIQTWKACCMAGKSGR
jgi:hypothetical protein